MSETFIDRLMNEEKELDIRLGKLRDFVTSPNFKEINPLQQNLVSAQFTAMGTYLQILRMRINTL